ncbi:hypothetical protein TNCV_2931561 [Trichonephila clavipes]|nr:hypothetical protein TNCV_2931561 [Trichonephila clavipes]
MATDFVILNQDQVTTTTPDLTLPSPNLHTTPMGGRGVEEDRFNVNRPPLHGSHLLRPLVSSFCLQKRYLLNWVIAIIPEYLDKPS